MKIKNITAIGLLIILVSFFAFCGTIPEEHKGAAVGAGLGAAAGVLLGGDTEGRIVGGLIGALVGGAIGHYAYDKPRSASETADTYNYSPAQGTIVTVEDAEMDPDKVRPGEVVEMKATYAVLTPSPDMGIDITEVREITHNGEILGEPRIQVTRDSGTYTSTVPLRLPSDAEKGTYVVTTKIESSLASDSRQSRFIVE